MLISESGQEIKRELYKSYLILVRSLYRQSQPDLITPQIGAVRKRFLVGSVIFLSFAMEAFINDFGDKYVDEFEDLEKLETLNKFLLFPKIARNNPATVIRKGESSFSDLKQLFRYRNYFVHYKPTFRNAGTDYERLYSELNHTTVKDLYCKMISLFKLFNDHFRMFEDENDWISIYSEDINAGV